MKVKPSAQELMTTQQTLMDLAAEANQLTQMLIECGGELTPELEARLDVNRELLFKKVDSYNFIMEQFEAQALLWKKRKDAMNAIQKRFESQVERLNDRIKLAMKEMGKDEIKGNLYRFKLVKSQPKLIIDDEATLPGQFKMIVQVTTTDKEKLKSALKDGFEIPGARLEETGALRIYENSED
jgi:hypothetical protein